MKSNILAMIFNNIGKILLYVFIIVGAYFLYRNFSKILSWFSSIFKNIKNENSAQNMPEIAETKSPEYDYPQTYIVGFAEQLYDSMKDFGTDHITLNSVYEKIKSNPKNAVRVFNAFGNRQYNGLTGTPTFGSPQNLWYWLKSELNTTSTEKSILLKYQKLFESASLI